MELKPTKCAICNSFNNSHILFPQRLPIQNLDASPYAPRRKRDFFHYRIVKCKNCGLLRSDPLIDETELKQLYFDSECTYTDENENVPLKKTYGNYFANMLNKYSIGKESFLDIGCSNGFMLEKALEFGFKKIVGIEPSKDAIDQASSTIKPFIVNGMFDDKMFEKNSFDLITFFQTFDHIAEPNIFLQNCFNILKDDGFILAINHNAKSFSARIMGEKSPIIDIGHAYLYDLTTMKKIFEQNNFVVRNVFPIKNIISMERLIQLLPIKSSTSEKIQQLARLLKINKCLLKLPLGNLGIVAQKLKTT
jgi:2-polyprenyl-3-methyl-5-hydroxy-6-metoxy-1,4-benzoquinol methylase